jgi:hypothetical protein
MDIEAAEAAVGDQLIGFVPGHHAFRDEVGCDLGQSQGTVGAGSHRVGGGGRLDGSHGARITQYSMIYRCCPVRIKDIAMNDLVVSGLHHK